MVFRPWALGRGPWECGFENSSLTTFWLLTTCFSLTIAPEHFDFIYPSTTWKTITFKNMSASDFEVDEDSFFIRVVE
jgi:hypothetical protein